MNTTKRKYESARQIARQASILKTTREMLSEVGYHATTIRGLAQKAGVAPGTLYNLYNSKDELVLAAVEDLLTEIYVEADRASQPGIERILAVGEGLADTTVSNPEYAEAMGRALFGVDADDPLTETLYARGIPEFERSLCEAQAAGEVREDIDVHAVAVQLQAQAWGIVMAWLMGIVSLQELKKEFMRCQLVILAQVACPTAAAGINNRINDL